eukprot:COSAG01_NODE_3965_length_5488_cov_130.219150_2_plen_70_part_00
MAAAAALRSFLLAALATTACGRFRSEQYLARLLVGARYLQIDQGQNGGKKELIDGRVWHRARNHDLWRT